MTDQRQRTLFDLSIGTSRTAEPISQPSSELETSSSGTATSSDATGTTQTRPATGPSARGSASTAGSSRSGALPTAACVPQLTLPISTGKKHTPDPMLQIERPRSRAECLQEARPCPWVGCRHHLLIEVGQLKRGSARSREGRSPSLFLNRPPPEPVSAGRRAGLRSSAGLGEVTRWIDDALELLSNMPYTCSLDFVDSHPQGCSDATGGRLLGVTRQSMAIETRDAGEALKRSLAEHDIESEEE